MEIYSLDSEDLTGALNAAKEILINALEKDGFLKASSSDLNAAYCVIAIRPGSLGKIWAKIRGLDKKDESFYISALRDAKIFINEGK